MSHTTMNSHLKSVGFDLINQKLNRNQRGLGARGIIEAAGSHPIQFTTKRINKINNNQPNQYHRPLGHGTTLPVSLCIGCWCFGIVLLCETTSEQYWAVHWAAGSTGVIGIGVALGTAGLLDAGNCTFYDATGDNSRAVLVRLHARGVEVGCPLGPTAIIHRSLLLPRQRGVFDRERENAGRDAAAAARDDRLPGLDPSLGQQLAQRVDIPQYLDGGIADGIKTHLDSARSQAPTVPKMTCPRSSEGRCLLAIVQQFHPLTGYRGARTLVPGSSTLVNGSEIECGMCPPRRPGRGSGDVPWNRAAPRASRTWNTGA